MLPLWGGGCVSCGEATPGPLVSSCSRREKAALNKTRNLQRICHSGTVLGRKKKKKKKQRLGWQRTMAQGCLYSRLGLLQESGLLCSPGFSWAGLRATQHFAVEPFVIQNLSCLPSKPSPWQRVQMETDSFIQVLFVHTELRPDLVSSFEGKRNGTKQCPYLRIMWLE